LNHTSPDNALLAAWHETLARCTNRPAVLAADGRVERRFAEIENEARQLAGRMAELPERAVVAVQLGNDPAWPALLLALFRRCLIPLPLGRHMAAAELQQALTTCGASALVTSDPGGLNVAPTNGPHAAPDADFLKLTSGTTSAPRAIRFRAAQLLADCDQICTTMGISERDLNFGVIPISHSYGFSNLLTPLLCRGVPLVVTDDRMPRAILDGLARSGATVFPGMPVFFQNLAELMDTPALPQLRLCISAGAPLARAVAEAFTAKFALPIHAFYGSSECGGIAYDTASEPGAIEEGFVGTALHGVTITHACGDESGPIEVRSAAVGDGYFPEEDPAALDGIRFVPGDLVQSTPRGLVLTGRASELINIAGRKLNPLEIEHRLRACPGVAQAVVFGVPSRTRGEEVIACVVAPDTDAAAIQRFCQLELSPWQIPRDIWMVPSIPANERGKISRRALAEQYLRTRTP
jgi:acyl-CoA synthetase (AMP-forming)/AMP-acid ligase II